MQTMSARGVRILSELEGIRRQMYFDSGGAPTIGIGHLLTADERASGTILIDGVPVPWRPGLTTAQCHALCRRDVTSSEAAVRNAAQVPLAQHQFDALVCWAFNVGVTALRNSTLLRLLNQRRYDAVPGQLRRWVYDNGTKVPGLIARRDREVQLWLDTEGDVGQ